MERGLYEESVEYDVAMPSPQLTEQATSFETNPMPLKHLKCFHHVLLL